jgi:ATP-binding cassette ChvD family protein
MAEFIFTMKGVTKVHPPDKKIIEDLYLSFFPNAKIGVIGVNGTGKSSLLRIMAGQDDSFTGEAWIRPGAKVGYLSQEPDLGDAKTVLEAVEAGVATVRAILDEFNELSMKLGEPMSDDEMAKLLDKQGALQDKIDAVDGWNLESTLEIAMDANHLDAESVAWLQGYLQKYPGCVILVTHDRYFLDEIVEWILELDRGEAHPFQGNYSQWLEAKEARLGQEDKKDSARKRRIARELEWVRSSPKARQAKSKARITAFESLVADASKARRDPNEIRIPPGPRLGTQVFEVDGVAKAYGDKLLFEDLSFRVPRGAIVGIVGPNGAGKTTLFRMLVGEEKPDAGTITVGDTVTISYVDQSHDALDDANNVFKEITGGADEIDVGGGTVKSRAYVGWFNFRGSDQQKPVKSLSGGERNRVHLAKLLKSGGNVLLLDEPTNDIDVETLRSLEEAILSFPGCALIISHDRWYLDRICTHILAFEGDSRVVWHEGSYADYAADRKVRLGTEADIPHRIKYRKFSR